MTSVSTPFIVYAAALFIIGIIAISYESMVSISNKVLPSKSKIADFLLLLWGLLMTVLISQEITRFLINQNTSPTKMSAGFITQFAALLYIIITRLKLPKLYDAPISSPHAYKPLSTIAHGFVGFFACIPLVWGTSFVWTQILTIMQEFGIHFKLEHQTVVQLFLESNSILLKITIVIFAGIIAPITEEILFRGILYRFFKNYLHRYLAVSLSAFLFAIMHFHLATFLPLFLLGLLLARSFERTGSITSPIILHACFNLNTLLMLVIEPNLHLL